MPSEQSIVRRLARFQPPTEWREAQTNSPNVWLNGRLKLPQKEHDALQAASEARILCSPTVKGLSLSKKLTVHISFTVHSVLRKDVWRVQLSACNMLSQIISSTVNLLAWHMIQQHIYHFLILVRGCHSVLSCSSSYFRFWVLLFLLIILSFECKSCPSKSCNRNYPFKCLLSREFIIPSCFKLNRLIQFDLRSQSTIADLWVLVLWFTWCGTHGISDVVFMLVVKPIIFVAKWFLVYFHK